jgi:hypothetical protein
MSKSNVTMEALNAAIVTVSHVSKKFMDQLGQ